MTIIPLASQALVTAGGRTVTATEVEAGLPTGNYAIAASEAGKLPGIGNASGFIHSDYQNPNWQTQVFRRWGTAGGEPVVETKTRHASSVGWSSWDQGESVFEKDVTSVAKAAGALAEGNTGTLTLRRVGNLVTARFMDLLLNPDSTGLVSFGTVPVGYRPAWYSSRYLWLIGLSNGVGAPQIVSLASNQLRWQGNLQGNTSRPTFGIQGEVMWETSTPWPTA